MMNKIKVVVILLLCCWEFSGGLARAQPFFQRGEGQTAPRLAFPRGGSPPFSSETERPDFQGCPWRREPPGAMLLLQREGLHLRLERIRNTAERLLENPHTSDDVKAKAHRLLELVNNWEDLRQKLDDSRTTFFQDNQKDLDEMCQLWERAKTLRQTLKEKREKMMVENRRTREDLEKVKQEVYDIAESVRQQDKRLEK